MPADIGSATTSLVDVITHLQLEEEPNTVECDYRPHHALRPVPRGKLSGWSDDEADHERERRVDLAQLIEVEEAV